MKRIRLLIIEEHTAVRNALAVRLRSSPVIEGILTAGNLAEGQERAHTWQPDVILVGWQRHKADRESMSQGVAALTQQGAAVIVLTSYADEIERELVLKRGARRYLLKDINTPQLMAEIEAVAGERKSSQSSSLPL